MIRRNVCLRILCRSRTNYTSQIGGRHFRTAVSSALQESSEQWSHRCKYDDDEYAAVDWNNLGFNFIQTDHMYVMKLGGNGEVFKKGQLTPFGNIELSPAAGVLNYGQGLFEGLKAYRREDGGICLFRPQENATRLQIGARRLCMPSPSVDQFIDAVKQTTLANKHWIPPAAKGSLYIRPVLIGSGPLLGVEPAPDYTFLVYASPVGTYFKGGVAPLNLYVEDEYHRATHGGAGGVKSITNYAPVMKAMSRAKHRGFSDVLYLDSVKKRYIEEVSACNVFIVKGNVVSTPAATGTILEGVTRKSIIDITRDMGHKVEERPITIDELMDADEVFCTGTGVGVVPVGSATYRGNRAEYNSVLWEKIHSTLTGIQRGIVEDSRGWMVRID